MSVRCWHRSPGLHVACGAAVAQGEGAAAGRRERRARRSAAPVVVTLLAGCAYEDDGGEPQPSAEEATTSFQPARSTPAQDSEVLTLEIRNYAEVERRLAEATGTVLLAASSAANGPSVGFHEVAIIRTAGPYTVALACAGIPYAQVILSQQAVGGKRDKIFEIDCSATQMQVVPFQEGYVVARLARLDPAGPWTGAVAGIRITGPYSQRSKNSYQSG